MNAYKTAVVEQKYIAFSYGDAMFITYNPQAILSVRKKVISLAI